MGITVPEPCPRLAGAPRAGGQPSSAVATWWLPQKAPLAAQSPGLGLHGPGPNLHPREAPTQTRTPGQAKGPAPPPREEKKK